MSVSTTSVSQEYAANGSTTAFPTVFQFLDSGDLVVTYLAPGDLAGWVTLTLGVDYTVSGGGGSNGTVTLTSAPPNNALVLITRQTPMLQPLSLSTTGPFPPKSIERAHDRETFQAQELSARADSLLDYATELDGRTTVTETEIGDLDGRASTLETEASSLTGSVTNLNSRVFVLENTTVGSGTSFATALASASTGALSLTIGQDISVFITLDSNLTINNPTVTGGALAAGRGTHLILHFQQDSTGYRKVTWGSNIKASSVQPKQGPNQTSAIHLIHSPDGTWRALSLDAIDTSEPLHVLDYGADPTGTADSAPAINACIYDASMVYHSKAILDHGTYRTDDTIHLGYGVSFCKAVLEGEGYAYNGGTGFAGSSIVPTKSDRPAVNFQGGRGSILRGVALSGLLQNWITTHNFCSVSVAPTLDDTLESNWVDSSLASTQDSRYAPYAGITIDAYAGTRPGTSYPDVAYPAALGSVAQYGKDFSSGCIIEDVQIVGFNTAVVNQPCDADGNGDFTKLDRVSFNYCKYGLSVGNTQARNFTVSDCDFAVLHTFLVHAVHGRQNGKISGDYRNLSGGASIQLLNLPNGTGIAGPVKFTEFYAEAMHRLGTLASPTAVETAVHFETPQVSFDLNNDTRGHPASHFDNGGFGGPSSGGGAVRFSGGNFTSFNSVFVCDYSNAKFDDCLFTSTRRSGLPGAISPYEQVAHNFLCGGLVLPGLVGDFMEGLNYPQYNLDTGGAGPLAKMRSQYQIANRSSCCPLYTGTVQCSGSDEAEAFTRPTKATVTTHNAWTSASLVGKTLTFTINLPDYRAELAGFAPGDVLWDQSSNTVFFIRSRTNSGSNSVVIAEAQNNYKSNGSGGWTLINPINLADSNAVYACNARAYSTIKPIFADSTASSANLTNCGTRNFFFESTDIVAGDRLWLSLYGLNWQSQFNSKIASITADDGSGNGTGTVALSGNATKTESAMRLVWWIRQPPANV